VNELIAEHEREIANPLLDYLSNRSDLKLIGKKTISDKDRAPTIAFTMNNKSGIDVNDGVVRTSMVHYNNHEDVNKLINALKQI